MGISSASDMPQPKLANFNTNMSKGQIQVANGSFKIWKLLLAKQSANTLAQNTNLMNAVVEFAHANEEC
jgi:hypothetical protein